MSVLLLAVFMAGCFSTTPVQVPTASSATPVPSSSIPAISPTPTSSAQVACVDKDCFITAATDCKGARLTLTDEAGVFEYSSSSTACVFTKTLVSLTEGEAQDMKNLLEGKSMTCKYEKGKFDSRLVTSLIYGTEYCEGDLKEALGALIIFT
ncbi:MAG TPA: hypothetical protein VJI71_02425 [Candidatus Norongarragalinales archaeon]|nr:hypothetical protein [Candidatus Norongarragalinales archaeon]